MFIPDKFPQFADDKTLIIVASSQSADLHIAYESQIETVAEIRIDGIEHDDQPGTFQRRSGGKTLGSNEPQRDEADKIKKKFHDALELTLNDISMSEIDQVILISSPQDKATTKAELPKELQDKITAEISGNFVDSHPKDIIEQISKAT
ncbi:MAG: host attachment protein [Candidatus Paceibacterota bacterium]